MPTIADYIAQIDSLPEEATIYAFKPWTKQSEACCVYPWEEERGLRSPNGAAYLLERFIIFEVLEGTFGDDWRSQPLDVLCDRVIDYAIRDA